MDSQPHQQLWERCRAFIRDNVDSAQYNTLFAGISSESFSDGRLVLCVPSDFFVDEIEKNYMKLLRSAITKVYGEGVKLYYRTATIQADPAAAILQKSTSPSGTIMAQSRVEAANPFREPVKGDFDPQLNPRYTFENYCLSESNKIARSIGEAIGDNPTLKTFNPLFVFGPSGVGKTHLIQAVGIRIKERNPQARVLYVTARLFQIGRASCRERV